MSSGHLHMPERYMMVERKVPSLVDMCVQLAVDNIRHLGDVGETDLHLLERILPHCEADQLKHIEDSTEERDLSPVTDKLWKKFYERQFGAKSTNLVCERMKQKKVSFRWRLLYDAKLKDLEEAQQKSFDRIKELYKKEDALPRSSASTKSSCTGVNGKQSRQVRITTKVPPSSNKRSFFGGGPGINVTNTKSNIMKKSKLQFLNCHEVKNLAAVKKIGFQKSNGISSLRKPGVLSGKNSASTSKPTGRRL